MPKRFNLSERGSSHRSLSLIMFLVVSFAVIGTFHSVTTHASPSPQAISSGLSGNCLDVHDGQTKPGAIVDAYGCNDTGAQVWTVDQINIKHGLLCLNVNNAAKNTLAKVSLASCNNSPNQVWLKDKNGLFNPGTQQCLSAPGGQTDTQLVVASCSGLGQPDQTWTSATLNFDCSSVVGQGNRVACFAEKEWEAWQTGSISHKSLLNLYTDGAPYEEWCADFVSYVYKEAGYPFSGGEADGWDESNANNIVNMGFTSQDPSSYIPQPGDVGYFSYSGGHVEIVISGGKNPTFIYGNSATIDPTTGNGQMEANTIVNDGNLGQLINYLTPAS